MQDKGEWTPRDVQSICEKGYADDLTPEQAEVIADAHNAALAAEREKVREAEAEQKATEAGYDMIAQENQQLRAQLAAEHELRVAAHETGARLITENDKLRAQLAAQEQSSWDEIAKLENKLAAQKAAGG